MRLHARTSVAGFSLAELVIVLTIIGVLTAIAQPKLSSYVERERVSTVARKLELDLALARSEAIKKRTDVTVRFDPAGEYYELVGVDNVATVDGIQATYRVNLKNTGVTVLGADFGGDGEVAFDAFGTPDTTGHVILDCGKTSCAVILDKVGGEIKRVMHAGDAPMSINVGGAPKVVPTKGPEAVEDEP